MFYEVKIFANYFLMPPYQPISCSFYDELEAVATLKKNVTIQYCDENGISHILTDAIATLVTKDKEEFVVLKNSNLIIRLDRLVEVNGKSPDLYC